MMIETKYVSLVAFVTALAVGSVGCVTAECQTAADCDDHDGCTADLCTPQGCSHELECSDAAQCDGTACICNPGYEGDGVVCTDIDECDADLDGCDANATCTNSEGGYACACNPGWAGDGHACADVDECLDRSDNCDAHAACINQSGSYGCDCDDGYFGDGLVCADIDECDAGIDLCHGNATCTNAVGGYECRCFDGFEGDGFTCLPTCGDLLCLPGETLSGCPTDCELDLSVIVASDLADALSKPLAFYISGLLLVGQRARVVVFEGGDVHALKALIASEVESHGVDGVFW